MKIIKSAKTWLVAAGLSFSIIACQPSQPQVVIDPNAQPQQYSQQAPTMYAQPAPSGVSNDELLWLYVLSQQHGSLFYGGGYMPHSYYYMQPSQRVYVYHQHYYNPGYGSYYNSRSYNRSYTYVPPRSTSNTYQSDTHPRYGYSAYGTSPSSPSVTTRNNSSAFSSGNNYRYGWGSSSSPSTTRSYSGSSSFRGGSSSYGSSSYRSYGGSSSYHSSSGFSSRSSSFGRH